MDIYNNKETDSNQSVYDAYNGFIMSPDRNIFHKLITRQQFFERIKNLSGDIVECGVFKGSGMMVWAKLLNMYSPHDIRKVVGFDFFDQSFVNDINDPTEKKMMEQVFSRCDGLSQSDISTEGLTAKFSACGINQDRYEFVKGDITLSSKQFLKERPGFRISLLYLDMDLEEPTYSALCNFWDRIVTGGVIVFDEYAYHMWTESNAVDTFLKEHRLTLHKTNVKSPTAYVIKK
jgi:hypothetical protein